MKFLKRSTHLGKAPLPRRAAALRVPVLVRMLAMLSVLAFPLSFTAQATSMRETPQAEPIVLAKEGKALLPVVVGPNASEATRAAAAELADYLGRITGATFTVEQGDGAKGIVVGQPNDFKNLDIDVSFSGTPFEREHYVLRSAPDALYLLGASDIAVSHAVWDLLYRLGHRQFFPTDKWEIIPQQRELSVTIADHEKPSFYARRIWYNWGTREWNRDTYARWTKRNRAIKGFDLNSGHAYEAIVAAQKQAFDAHPEYFALIDDKRHTTGNVKFCISNPGLRQTVVDYALNHFKKHPDADSVSMDPSDGGGWCQCEPCATMGSVSDRVLILANAVAEAINKDAPRPRYVGMYAYNKHAPPPSVKSHPNVIVSVTTAFLTGGYTFDQVLEGWRKAGATMGTYDYLSVVAWDWNLPRSGRGSDIKRVGTFLPEIHGKGVRFYDAESGDVWGMAGLGYYLTARVLWDIEEAKRIDELVEDFLDKSFGPAKEPMHAFYELITTDRQRRSPGDMVGRMYRHLDAARKATSDQAAMARIDDLILYTRWAELYYGHQAGHVDKQTVAKFAWDIRGTSMIHTYGLWSRLVNQRAALDADHPWKSDAKQADAVDAALDDVAASNEAQAAAGHPFTRAQVDAMLAEGIAKNQPVETSFVAKEYSRELVPAGEALGLKSDKPGSFPTVPQDRQRYYLWLDEAGDLAFDVTVQKVWANRAPEMKLYSPLEVTVEPVAVFTDYAPDGQTRAVTLKTPHAGLHRLETVDGGDYTRFNWPDGLPVTVESGMDTTYVTTHFRGPWSLYFYVPKGTKTVAGWASRIANWSPRISGALLDGDGNIVFDFGTADEGFFEVAVKPGQDGRLWKFENNQGQRLLATVPPYLARSADELLLPREVVEADQKVD